MFYEIYSNPNLSKILIYDIVIGERIKQLRAESRKLGAALIAARALDGLEDLGDLKERLRVRREAAKAEAAALANSGRARVEDLSVFRVKKETKKGKEHEYWHAAWMIEGKVRNVYLGSSKKMSQKEALEKARRRKAEGLGIEK
jgi:hypothetical protein